MHSTHFCIFFCWFPETLAQQTIQPDQDYTQQHWLHLDSNWNCAPELFRQYEVKWMKTNFKLFTRQETATKRPAECKHVGDKDHAQKWWKNHSCQQYKSLQLRVQSTQLWHPHFLTAGETDMKTVKTWPGLPPTTFTTTSSDFQHLNLLFQRDLIKRSKTILNGLGGPKTI